MATIAAPGTTVRATPADVPRSGSAIRVIGIHRVLERACAGTCCARRPIAEAAYVHGRHPRLREVTDDDVEQAFQFLALAFGQRLHRRRHRIVPSTENGS